MHRRVLPLGQTKVPPGSFIVSFNFNKKPSQKPLPHFSIANQSEYRRDRHPIYVER